MATSKEFKSGRKGGGGGWWGGWSIRVRQLNLTPKKESDAKGCPVELKRGAEDTEKRDERKKGQAVGSKKERVVRKETLTGLRQPLVGETWDSARNNTNSPHWLEMGGGRAPGGRRANSKTKGPKKFTL